MVQRSLMSHTLVVQFILTGFCTSGSPYLKRAQNLDNGNALQVEHRRTYLARGIYVGVVSVHVGVIHAGHVLQLLWLLLYLRSQKQRSWRNILSDKTNAKILSQGQHHSYFWNTPPPCPGIGNCYIATLEFSEIQQCEWRCLKSNRKLNCNRSKVKCWLSVPD